MSKQLFAAALLATSTVLALESPEQCATACNQAYSLCQVTPVNGTSANQSYCASKLASCVGYNPFKASGYEKPTACVQAGSSTSTTCTTTSTTAAPPAPTYGGDACANTCVQKYRACQGSGDPNESECASELSSCVGYNPFNNAGSFVTPTACAKPTTLSTSTSCTTTGKAPAPTTTKAAPAPAYKDACAKKCADELNKCQGSGDPNESLCGANYAKCLGFNPFTNTATFITPTACAASTGAPAPAPTGNAPAPSAPKPATTAAAASQIGDGQVQAPTGRASQISDGQVQAPTGTAAAPAPASTTQTQVTNGASALSFSNLLFLAPAVFFL